MCASVVNPLPMGESGKQKVPFGTWEPGSGTRFCESAVFARVWRGNRGENRSEMVQPRMDRNLHESRGQIEDISAWTKITGELRITWLFLYRPTGQSTNWPAVPPPAGYLTGDIGDIGDNS